MTTISGIIIFIVFNGIGFVLLFRAVTARRKLMAAKAWPNAQGVILTSGVEEDDRRSATGKVEIAFRPVITYHYNVLGQTYQGTRVTLGEPLFNYIDAHNISERFLTGAQVPVYYNPDRPEEAVLAPKSPLGMFPLTPGAFFVLLGVVVGLYTVFSR